MDSFIERHGKVVEVFGQSIRISNVQHFGLSGDRRIDDIDLKVSYLKDNGTEYCIAPVNLTLKDKLASVGRFLSVPAKIYFLEKEKEELMKKSESEYLFVTTFQGDNFKFYAKDNPVRGVYEELKKICQL